jgi:hypothetical protein
MDGRVCIRLSPSAQIEGLCGNMELLASAINEPLIIRRFVNDQRGRFTYLNDGPLQFINSKQQLFSITIKLLFFTKRGALW